jgi:hypothetical protein
VAFVFSALGMLAGQWLGQAGKTTLPAADASTTASAESVPSFELVDAQGRRRILMATSNEENPAIWFFDANGKARLNLGLYGDDNAFVVLNDDQERAVQIRRTLGARSAPYLVMKPEGRDRIIMGLGGAAQDPFLVHYDPKGTMQTVFGSYSR